MAEFLDRLKRRGRQLRVRLALSGFVFSALLLLLAGLLFYRTLDHALDVNLRNSMEQDWQALNALLVPERSGIRWETKADDPEEALLVNRLRHVLLVADESGRILHVSGAYLDAGLPGAAELRKIAHSSLPLWQIRSVPTQGRLLFRTGGVTGPHEQRFVLSIGRSLAENEAVLRHFIELYGLVMPLLLVVAAWLSWYVSGKALRPIRDLAQAAQTVTSENLDLQIPSRQTGDELDILIRSFNDLVARLGRSFRQIRRFSTDVSHELRTPVTVVQGQLEVALMTARTLEDYRAATESALASARRLSKIIQTLLLLAEAEAGHTPLEIQPLSLTELVKELNEQMEFLAARGKVRWSTQITGEAVIEADRLQMERMLINLLSNAFRFTAAGGEVRLRVRPAGGKVEFIVEDTGCGISREHLNRIFDRFYRANDDKVTGDKGLGLGLSFVIWIVKAHHGSIDVASEPGRGTRFTVILPLQQPVPAHPAAARLPSLEPADRTLTHP